MQSPSIHVNQLFIDNINSNINSSLLEYIDGIIFLSIIVDFDLYPMIPLKFESGITVGYIVYSIIAKLFIIFL